MIEYKINTNYKYLNDDQIKSEINLYEQEIEFEKRKEKINFIKLHQYYSYLSKLYIELYMRENTWRSFLDKLYKNENNT